MAWEVDDLEATVKELRRRGVVLEEYEAHVGQREIAKILPMLVAYGVIGVRVPRQRRRLAQMLRRA